MVSKQKKVPKRKSRTKKRKLFYDVDLVITSEEGLEKEIRKLAQVKAEVVKEIRSIYGNRDLYQYGRLQNQEKLFPTTNNVWLYNSIAAKYNHKGTEGVKYHKEIKVISSGI